MERIGRVTRGWLGGAPWRDCRAGGRAPCWDGPEIVGLTGLLPSPRDWLAAVEAVMTVVAALDVLGGEASALPAGCGWDWGSLVRAVGGVDGLVGAAAGLCSGEGLRGGGGGGGGDFVAGERTVVADGTVARNCCALLTASLVILFRHSRM